jgi:predicted Fe-Mo cluster-binding NifX family protein
MKIAVATTNGGLEDSVSPVFGRCKTYTILKIEEENIKNVEVIPNQFMNATGGAGIQAAQFILNQEVKAVIAGNFGPNVHSVFNSTKVKMVQAQGIVKDVALKYIKGEFSPVSTPTFGGGGRGMGRRRGMMQATQGQTDVNILETRVRSLERQLEEMRKELKKVKEEEK